jgi:hypothetical protein
MDRHSIAAISVIGITLDLLAVCMSPMIYSAACADQVGLLSGSMKFMEDATAMAHSVLTVFHTIDHVQLLAYDGHSR